MQAGLHNVPLQVLCASFAQRTSPPNCARCPAAWEPHPVSQTTPPLNQNLPRTQHPTSSCARCPATWEAPSASARRTGTPLRGLVESSRTAGPCLGRRPPPRPFLVFPPDALLHSQLQQQQHQWWQVLPLPLHLLLHLLPLLPLSLPMPYLRPHNPSPPFLLSLLQLLLLLLCCFGTQLAAQHILVLLLYCLLQRHQQPQRTASLQQQVQSCVAPG